MNFNYDVRLQGSLAQQPECLAVQTEGCKVCQETRPRQRKYGPTAPPSPSPSLRDLCSEGPIPVQLFFLSFCFLPIIALWFFKAVAFKVAVMGFVARRKWKMQFCAPLLQIAEISLWDVIKIGLLLPRSPGRLQGPAQATQPLPRARAASVAVLCLRHRGLKGPSPRVARAPGVWGARSSGRTGPCVLPVLGSLPADEMVSVPLSRETSPVATFSAEATPCTMR